MQPALKRIQRLPHHRRGLAAQPLYARTADPYLHAAWKAIGKLPEVTPKRATGIAGAERESATVFTPDRSAAATI